MKSPFAKLIAFFNQPPEVVEVVPEPIVETPPPVELTSQTIEVPPVKVTLAVEVTRQILKEHGALIEQASRDLQATVEFAEKRKKMIRSPKKKATKKKKKTAKKKTVRK